MTKKEKLYEAVQEMYPMHYVSGPSVRALFVAIIDALPDEAASKLNYGEMKPCPVCGKVGCRELHRRPHSIFGPKIDPEEARIEREIEEVKADKPKSDWARVYHLAGELIQLSECRPDPPATSGATQPPIDQIEASYSMGFMHGAKDAYAKVDKSAGEDARKLRIMKAMEERPDGVFKLVRGEWHRLVQGGDFSWANWMPVGDAAPEEPLWEGAVWTHENQKECLGWAPTDPEPIGTGWRKIKVRETRE